MNTSWSKLLIAVLVAVGISLMGASATLAGESDGIESFCQAWANNPYKNGSVVYGTGGVSCSTAVAQIHVVVQVENSAGGRTNPAAEKYCYNTSSCQVTASLGFTSGLLYRTSTSGYVGMWNGWYGSDWVDF